MNNPVVSNPASTGATTGSIPPKTNAPVGGITPVPQGANFKPYAGDPIQPSPTLLRRIATALRGADDGTDPKAFDEAQTSAKEWAQTFFDHYPNP